MVFKKRKDLAAECDLKAKSDVYFKRRTDRRGQPFHGISVYAARYVGDGLHHTCSLTQGFARLAGQAIIQI